MPVDAVWAWLGLFILAGFTLEAITGFGGTVIALALGALWLPIGTLVPLLVPLSMALGLAMAWRHRGHIDHRLLWRVVLPGMAAGTGAGYLLRPWLDETLMRQLFGALIMAFAARGLWRLRRPGAPLARPLWMTRGLTTLAGVTHGLFASGGPLLVVALAGLPLNKATFRVTLIVVWLILDTGLSLAFAADGRLLPVWPLVLAYLPVVALGIVLGERLHNRVSEAHFRVAIDVLLLVCGALLLGPR
jgi:uncharacterized membrane protein YfcA